jgi:AAA domain
MTATVVSAHVERVLEQLRKRRLNPRPHPSDQVRWDADCPVCGGQLVLRDVVMDDGSRRVMLFCDCAEHDILHELGLRERDVYGYDDPRTTQAAAEFATVTLEEFVGVDEPGAQALLGDNDAAVIPEGGDVMIYGAGGAGKTTLALDLAFHLAAGEEWLGIPVPRPTRVLLIENEGPRPLLRKKLRRKREAWAGAELADRVRVFDRPWGEFSLQTEEWRQRLADVVAAHKIDVVIVGPLTRIGMNDAGTLQEVVAFMELVVDVRRLCGRPVTVILVHHENKAGAVSGAWEGSGDTLLHVKSAGNGHTVVRVQKARWSSLHSGKTLKLAWTGGEGYEVEADERDYRTEVVQLLAKREWLTVGEIAAPVEHDPPGVGAGEKTVKAILEGDPETFEFQTGADARALGRSFNAKLWRLGQTAERSRPSDRDALFPVVSGRCEASSPSPFALKNGDDATGDDDGSVEASIEASTETAAAGVLACCCADGGVPAGDGRCSRCWGALKNDADGRDAVREEDA